MGPAATPGRAPKSGVDAVGRGFGGHRKPAGFESGDGPLARERLVADRGEDGELGSEHPQGDIETDLIVARAGGAVSDRARPDRPGYLDQGNGLLGALRGHRERIDLAAQHIALNQITDEAIEHLGAGVDLVVLRGADRHGLLPDRRALLGAGAPGIHIDGVDRISLLPQPGDAIGGVQPAGEGERESRFLHIA